MPRASGYIYFRILPDAGSGRIYKELQVVQ